MASAVHHSKLDVSSVQFAKTVAKTNKGSKIAYVNFDDGSRVRFQTPVLTAPFGISSFDEQSGGKSYTLDGSFRGFENNKAIADFLAKMRSLDDRLLEVAAANSRDWFGKASSKEVLGELVRKLVREPNDPKYAPTIRFKISTGQTGAPATLFFDENKNPVDMNYLVKGSSFRALVEVSSIWFVQRSFGITLRLLQVAVTSRPANRVFENSTEFGFVDGDGDEEEVVIMDDEDYN